MSSETQEPPLGTPNPDPSAPEPDVTQDTAKPGEPPPVAPQPYYSGSGDDLSLSLSAVLAHAKPDPLLGEFKPSEPPPVAEAVVPYSSSEDLSALDIEKPLPLQPDQPAGSFDAIAPLPPTPPAEAVCESPPATPAEEPTPEPAAADVVSTPLLTEIPPEPVAEALPVPEPESEPAAPESPFAGLDLSAPPSAKPAPAKKEEDEDDDDDYEDEPRGPSLAFVLLLSYASAVTIGLLWVLWGNRLGKTTDEEDPPPANTSADPGIRSRNSRKITPPPPIAAEYLTTLGKPVILGGVEVTPIEVTSGPVELQRIFNAKERQQEGGNALKLHLKIRNVTKDAEFDPCDEAFLREREAGVADSFIEAGDGKMIEMYPLAVTSEWAVVGQNFKTLKPGATLDTLIVSNKAGFEQKTPEMTWRVRLRTGVEQTDSFGVRFKDSDVKPGR